jgi:E3 SUMO-protein ligase PIAS1
MLYCARDYHSYAKSDISFPHQVEIKVNGDELKANLKGLKNKPGSTRPADITDLLRTHPPDYSNKIEMTFALTDKVDYYFHQFPH